MDDRPAHAYWSHEECRWVGSDALSSEEFRYLAGVLPDDDRDEPAPPSADDAAASAGRGDAAASALPRQAPEPSSERAPSAHDAPGAGLG